MFMFLVAGAVLADTSLMQEDWSVVNDTVMGGVSSSSLERNDGLLFSGTLSLENNGGFVSMRTQTDLPPLIGTEGLRLHAKSTDGNTYQLVLWIEGYGPRLYYKHDFEPINEPQELYFADFQAVSYGRQVSAPPLDKQLQAVRSVGILMGDKQEGEFALKIQELSIIGEVTVMQGSTGIQAALTRAIQRGVPEYNQGNHARCAAIYQTALEDILLLRPDDINPSQRKLMERSLQEARAVDNDDERAWAYRKIMDSLMSTL